MKRQRLQVTSQTLWKRLDVLAAELGPTYEALREKILAEPVIGLDQTRWKRLLKKQSTPYQMWRLTTSNREGTGALHHTNRDDKSRATFDDIIGDFQGAIVCDAMSTHKSRGPRQSQHRTRRVLAHVHRKFQEVEGEHPGAERALAWIRKLYELDAQAQSLDELAAIRDARALARGAGSSLLHRKLRASNSADRSRSELLVDQEFSRSQFPPTIGLFRQLNGYNEERFVRGVSRARVGPSAYMTLVTPKCVRDTTTPPLPRKHTVRRILCELDV